MSGDGRVPSAINGEFSDLVAFLFMFRKDAGDGDKLRPKDLDDLDGIQRRFVDLYAVMREMAARFVDAADRQLFIRLRARGFRFEAVTDTDAGEAEAAAASGAAAS
jgi:hypothetical protein